MKTIKKIIMVALALMLAFSTVACSPKGGDDDGGDNNEKPQGPTTSIEDALNERVYFNQEDLVLESTTFSLILKKTGVGYSIVAVDSDDKVIALSEQPIYLSIAGDLSIVPIEETAVTGIYSELCADSDKNVCAKATITTPNGSQINVMDTFTFIGNSIDMTRQINVVSANEKDKGIASRIIFRSNTEKTKFDACEYFIPGIMYKDNQNVVTTAIGSSFNKKAIVAKETRTGLPMVTLREKETGATISLAHRNPQLSSPDERDYAANTINDNFKCGSIGIIRESIPAVLYSYPVYETQGYKVNSGTTKRFFTLKKGAGFDFTVGVYGDTTDNYTDATVDSYKEHFNNQQKEVSEVDLGELYDISISDLKSLFSYNSNNGAAGLPFATFVHTGKHLDISYQMGFIGMQTSLAHQMIRYGLKYTDSTSYNNGLKVIDYWVESAAVDSGVFRVWGTPNGFAGTPCYLRMMTDGAEGILDAYRLIKQEGRQDIDTTAWYDALIGYADFLVEKQNEDGSWYRAYDLGGNLFTEDNYYGQKGDKNTLADSKLNTPIGIRFLIRMHELTKDQRYINAAKKAGEYTINNISSQGKYVGGTPDNANTCDREAGIFAMYAFNALYSATKEAKYLYYAEQAAIFTLSWMYTYNFSADNEENLLAGKIYEEGLVSGLSIIATGHSSIDTFMAYAYYELFKLYVWTGDTFYYDASLFVQNNTKQTVSCVNDLGYTHGSFAIEATDVSDFYFITAERYGVWLPWITNANVEPIANMLQTFGVADVREAAKLGIDALNLKLNTYGAGGNPYGYVI